MKRCYVGVGGIGCSLLKEYEKTRNGQDKFIYIDAVPDDLHCLDEKTGECYALTNQKYGCSLRIIGKDEIKAVIYNGAMPKFIDDFFLADKLEVIFVTTTFGGFGSAVVYELSDYYGVKIRNYRQDNNVKTSFSCKVIAFPLQNFNYLKYAPETQLSFWSTNEIECINEFRDKEARNNEWYQERSNCMPVVDLYVPLSCNGNKCVDMCIKNARYLLTENFIRQLLLTLKNGTKVSREDWYMSESYKTFSDSAKLLLNEYNTLEKHNLKDILFFHSRFEKEKPLILEDRRIGKLLVFKECLKNNIKPFVIEHEISEDYYALLEFATDNIEELCDLCHKAQERFSVKCQNSVKII